jgi:hypothetical protein
VNDSVAHVNALGDGAFFGIVDCPQAIVDARSRS